MLKKTLISLSILACALVLPMLAQTPPPVANETMGTNPAATKSKTTVTKKTTKTEVKTETKAEEKHETKAEEKAEHKTSKHVTHHRTTSHGGAYGYATHLAALLADTQGKATLSAASWKSIANEANALSNKLYASTSGKTRTAAKDARTHVREMHAAAMKGDADGAKPHAAQALPYVYTVIDATAPKKK
jgi:hypothetical protein